MARLKERIDTLPNEWYKEVLNLYSQGASDVEIKALIYNWRGTFSNDLWDRWIEEEEEFSSIINKGRKLSPKGKIFISNNRKDILKKRRETRNHKDEYKKNNIASSQRSLLYYHLRKKGISKSNKTFSLFGYTPKQLIENILPKLNDGMTLENYGKWHIDHIKPLSLFNLEDFNQIKEAWSFKNLQPLWAKDNIRKSNKYDECNG